MVRKKRLTSIFLRLARRQNAKDWAQSAAVVSIGGIAITLFCGFLANSSSLEQRINRLCEQSAVADVYVTVDPRIGAERKEADMLLENIPDFYGAESRFTMYCTLGSQNALMAVSPDLPSYSHPYDLTKLTEDHRSDHFFLVDTFLTSDYLADGKIHVGEPTRVTMSLSSFGISSSSISALDLFLKEGAENPLKKNSLDMDFVPTGAMKHVENATKATTVPSLFLVSSSYFRDALRTTLAESFTEDGLKAIWRLGFQIGLGWGDGDPYGSTVSFPMPNQFLLRLKQGANLVNAKQAVVDYYASKSVDNLYLCQTRDEISSLRSLRVELGQAVNLTYVFPVVFFLVALLVIVISVRQMVLRERLDIGTFKALGVSKAEIHRHYALKTTILVLLGVIAGEIIGPILVPSIMGAKYGLLYTIPERQFVFPVWQCLLAGAVFLGVALLTTWWVARREIARKPVDSLRPLPPQKRAKPLTGQHDKGRLGLSLTMAGRSARSDPVKAFMVILGVLGCTALLCCGFGIEDTIAYGVDTDPLVVSKSDVTVFYADEESQSEIEGTLAGINEEEALLSGHELFARKSMDILANNQSYYTVGHFYGEYKLDAGSEVRSHFPYEFPKDQVLLSDKVARTLNVKKGDKVEFALGRFTVEIPVYDVVAVFYDNGFYMHADSPLLEGATIPYNGVFLDAMSGMIPKLEEKAKALPKVALCENEASWRKKVQDAMGSILTMTNAIKVFAFLLAAVVLYDLGLLAFKEKQREIATMKVLGFRSFEIMTPLILESLALSTIGIGAGLAVGFPFTKLVLFINQVELVDFLYTVYPLSYLIAFAFTFVLSVFINLLLTFRVRKIMAVESLKSVE